MGVVHNIQGTLVYTIGIAKALVRVMRLARRKSYTFPDFAEDLAERYGDRPALLSDREVLTYAAYNARANRYARWAIAHGIEKGDVVCLLMPNRPEFAAVWLGITRVGGVVALLNTHLRGKALAYCINIVEAKHVIVADEMAETFATAKPLLTLRPTVWRHGGIGEERRIDQIAATLDDGPLPPDERRDVTQDDKCLYIYTSGTTGLPKAANITHYRVYAAMVAYSSIMDATERDRMYDCLPLYHTVGGVIALGACLVVGGSVFIREKFSAGQFWDDVVEHDCTLFQYVGELCRYLLNAPVHPREGEHRIRLACGNGLRPDIWGEFKNRFRIRHIREFYAATEGNAIMFNLDNTPGAIGRCPFWMKPIFPIINIRFDIENEREIRSDQGLCVACAPDEVGELIAKIIIHPAKPGQRFDGYVDRVATEQKVLHDVFEKGDKWFRTSDLVRRDRRGNYYFIDRIGDTYRWKGENVSTSEVAETISTYDDVREATVFGVAIANHDGKAGMASIVVGPDFSLEKLRAHVHERLPPYARPVFVRLQDAIDATSTFKQRKLGLMRDGFDPAGIADLLYFDDPRVECYVRLDEALHREIQSGKVRL